MFIKEFRNDVFVDRMSEIEFIKEWVNHTPKEILWLYGPKSCGKTTLIEYIIEKELTSNLKIFDKYWIKYINFRGLMIENYDSFINSFFEESEESDDFEEETKTKFSLGVIKLEAKTLEKIKTKKKNLFNELIEKLKQVKKTKIIVIDEIQVLEDIYFNEEKQLLKEFLNFCVRLTKELHLAHIIILSSNTIFIDKIYNEAKLKVTSRFKKIDHLDKKNTFEYIEYKNKEENLNLDKNLIYEYLGGSVALISRLYREIKFSNSLESYLENEVKVAKNEIIFNLKRVDKEIKEKFKIIIKAIIKNGYFLDDSENDEYLKTIDIFCEQEILFFDSLENKVSANNRLYQKSFEFLI